MPQLSDHVTLNRVLIAGFMNEEPAQFEATTWKLVKLQKYFSGVAKQPKTFNRVELIKP